jgi:hypothetical protein
MPYKNYWKDVVRAMATDDECALTHVPGSYYGACPDCGLTRTPRAASLPIGVPSLVIGSLLIGAAVIVLGSMKKKRRRR